MNINIPSLFLRSWKRLAIGIVCLLLLYSILGFFILPAVLKRQIPERLGKLLKREVSVSEVRVNPFALSISLEGFRVKDLDGGDFLAWKSLYINLEISSLFSKTTTFKAIEWQEPKGRVVVAKNGKMNFSDILDSFSAKEPAKAPQKKEDGKELAIGHFAVRGLKLELRDNSPKESFSTTLGPVGFEVNNFKTRRNANSPYAFMGMTEAQERFEWKGALGAEPLHSKGEFSIQGLNLPKYHPYYLDQVAFDLREGKLNFKADYVFEWFNNHHTLKIQKGALELLDLKLHRIGKKTQPELSLPRIEASGFEMDVLGNTLELDILKLQGLQTHLSRSKEGKINLVELLTPKPSPKKKEEEKPFKLKLNELICQDFQIAFSDEMPSRPVSAKLTLDKLSLKNFSLDPECLSTADLEMKIDGKATLKAEGTLKPFTPSVDLKLKLDGLEIPPFDPYLEPNLALRIPKGRFAAEGRMRGEFQGKKSDYIKYQGNIELTGFEAMDALQQEPFLRYQKLKLAGIDLRTNPDVFKIRQVELLGPESRLVVAKDGTTNVARALKMTEVKPAAPASSAGSAAPPTPGKPFKIGIASIKINKGNLAYIDRSLEPNAALTISDLHGSYLGLSTEPETRSAVELKGLAGGLAPITIKGQAMPLRHDQDTDIILKIEGSELTDFSPYAMKHLGYVIRKGKLDVDASVKIRKRQLDAKFNTRLNQFFLGDKVQSPDAVKLPVKLALALLRDRKGVINLELPVDGNLDSPDFHYGKIIWKTVLNVLTKIITSPFDLLAKAFGGGGQDLSFASFQPGSTELDADATKKLDVIAKSMVERPELTLEIEGGVDLASDGASIRKAALEEMIREAKAKHLQAGKADLDTGNVNVGKEERERWLTAAFESRYPTPQPQKGQKAQPAPPPLEMEQRLLGSINVDPNKLRELASERSKNAMKHLISAGKIEASRLFEVQVGERRKEGGCKVLFGLKQE